MKYIELLEDIYFSKKGDVHQIGKDINSQKAGALIHAGKAKFVSEPQPESKEKPKKKAAKVQEVQKENVSLDVESDSDINE